MTIKGSCYCGDVEFTLEETPSELSGVFCHCVTCQKLNTDRSYNIGSSKDKLKVTKGEPKVFVDGKADVGKSVHRSFCSNCGSSLFSTPDSMPGVVFVKVGVLEAADQIKPATEIYVDTQLPKIDFQSGFQKDIKRYEGMMAKDITA